VASSSNRAQNRGRLQVQGVDIGEPGPSFPWAGGHPPTKVAAQQGLSSLEQACTQQQLNRRTMAFPQAAAFIAQGPYVPPPPVVRSFFNRGLPKRYKNCRVDIEIWTGVAFT
jgi:hypothetical protein